MDEYKTEEFRRGAALAMAKNLELNAMGFDKRGMTVEANACRAKVKELRDKWEKR